MPENTMTKMVVSHDEGHEHDIIAQENVPKSMWEWVADLPVVQDWRNRKLVAGGKRRLPPERFEWRVRTVAPEKNLYDGIPCVTMLPRLSDEEVREEYRQADLLCMPMLDSAANNVFLESMACGTPVMTNRVGGVPEYVAEDCNAVMPTDASVDDGGAKLTEFSENGSGWKRGILRRDTGQKESTGR